MPAQTRTRGAPATGRGRFARGRATPARRSTRSPGLRRRTPHQSRLKQLASSLLPGAAAKQAAPSSKKGKAGGLALAAAAAGMAFKNRDKLTQRLHRQDRSHGGADANHDAATPPATPVV
jgi:hypothetical protein